MLQRIHRRRTAHSIHPLSLTLFLFISLYFSLTVHADNLTLQSASQLFLELQSCNASITSSVTSVECTFLAPSNITTRAQLLDIPCGEFNRPAEDSDATSIVPFDANSTTNLVTATFLETGITALEKNGLAANNDTTTNATNTTLVNRTYCARIDLLTPLSSPSSPSSNPLVSILAKKFNVTITYRYATLASFSVDRLQIAEYRPPASEASALRTPPLRAFQCDDAGVRDEYAVDVGRTLHLCIANSDAYDDDTGEYDADAIASGRVDARLEKVEYLGFEGEKGMVVEPVRGGVADFITEFDCGVEGGMKCHVKTLMVPDLFDEFGGEPMKALGVVEVRFLGGGGGESDGKRGLEGDRRRRVEDGLGHGEKSEDELKDSVDRNENKSDNHIELKQQQRKLQSLSKSQDAVPFAVVFQLGPSTTADRIQSDLDKVKSGGMRSGVFARGISLTVGVAIFTTWMIRRHG